MAYTDMFTNNDLYQLTHAANTPAKPDHKAVLRPPPRHTNYRGDTIYPKTVWNAVVPDHVTHLDVSLNTFDERYAVYFPNHVKWLNLSHTNYGDWFMVLPKDLESLMFRDTNETMYKLPKGLKFLDMTRSPQRFVPELPETLEVLILRDCYNLEGLPDRLPASLRVLDVRNCRKLTKLPTDVPEGLTEVWADGCEAVDDWLWENGYKWGVGSYWATAKFLRQMHERIAQERAQTRCRTLRQELIAAAYHPRRVERWLEARGWDILEEMLG